MVCQKRGLWVCRNCNLKLGEPCTLTCAGCDAKSDRGLTCSVCTDLGSPLDQLLSSFAYESQVFHKILAAYKEDGNKQVLPFLSRRWLDCCIKNLSLPQLKQVLVIPIPATKKRMRTRGFNQSELLAKLLANKLRLKISTSVLICSSKNRAQKTLNRADRRLAIKDVYSLGDTKLSSSTIILVDDVATTLATLETCANLLKKAGAAHVIGTVLSHAK